jgi:hypothetical protein
MTTNDQLKSGQRLIAIQIAISVIFQLAWIFWIAPGISFAMPAIDDLGSRLAFAVQWQLLGGLVLLAMIGFIAGNRPLSLDVIDGNDRAERLAIQVRIQRNTVEQLLLMVVAHLALATLLRAEQLALIPALVVLFCISRLVYWVGYSINPLYRTLGFVATFYPNIGALLYGAWLFMGQ